MMKESKILLPINEINKQVRHMSYVEFGLQNNDNILVCAHALAGNSRDFDYLAMRLKSFYRVISFDIAGRGRSDWLENPKDYNYETYILDVMFLLKSLGVSKCDWVGTSMGGIIGMNIDAEFPGLINKMVLNDIGPEMPIKTLEKIGRYIGRNPVFANENESKRHLKRMYSPFGIKEESHWDHLHTHSIMEHDDGLKLHYDPAISEVFHDNIKDKKDDINLWNIWNKGKAELMIIRGENSDILTKNTYNKITSEPRVTKNIIINDAGHAPALMDDSLIDEIESWLCMTN